MPGLTLFPVESTALSHVGYDPQGQVLGLLFKSGGLYEYGGVPPEVHQGLLEAPSKGRYFQEHIEGRYPYRRLTQRRRRK